MVATRDGSARPLPAGSAARSEGRRHRRGSPLAAAVSLLPWLALPPLLVGVGSVAAVEWRGLRADQQALDAALAAADSAIAQALENEGDRTALAARALSASANLAELMVLEGPVDSRRPIDAWLEGAASDLRLDAAAIFTPAGQLVASVPGPESGSEPLSLAEPAPPLSGSASTNRLEQSLGGVWIVATASALQRFDPVATVRVARVVDERRLSAWAGAAVDALMVAVDGDLARALASTLDAATTTGVLTALDEAGLLADANVGLHFVRSRSLPRLAETGNERHPRARVAVHSQVLDIAGPERTLLVVLGDSSADRRRRDRLLAMLAALTACGLLAAVVSSVWLGGRRARGLERLERWLHAPELPLNELPNELAPVGSVLEGWQAERAGERELADRVALAIEKGAPSDADSRQSREDGVIERDGLSSQSPSLPEARIRVLMELRSGVDLAHESVAVRVREGDLAAEAPGAERLPGVGLGRDGLGGDEHGGDWLAAARSVLVACGGRFGGCLGSRMYASFAGSGSAHQALAAISQISEFVRSANLGSIAAAVVVEPSVSEHGPGCSGESLLREAQALEVLISDELAERLAGSLAAAGVEIRQRLGLFELASLHSLSVEAAGRLTLGLAAHGEGDGVRERAPAGLVSPLAVGDVVAERYEIWSWQGVSSQAIEYRGWDSMQQRQVLVQSLKQGVWLAPLEQDRLVRSLSLARRLDDPHVVRLVDVLHQPEGTVVITEWRWGIPLREVLERASRLPLAAGMLLGARVCAALAAAHRIGLLHLDLSPDNIWLGPSGEVRVADFGIAQPRLRERGKACDGGLLVGGVDYLAPEQVDGPTPDTRSDVYAMGAVFYEALSGRRPFESSTPMSILRQHLEEPPPSPLRWAPHLPRELERVLLTCLAKNPEDRYFDGQELAEAWRVLAREVVIAPSPRRGPQGRSGR